MISIELYVYFIDIVKPLLGSSYFKIIYVLYTSFFLHLYHCSYCTVFLSSFQEPVISTSLNAKDLTAVFKALIEDPYVNLPILKTKQVSICLYRERGIS